LKATEEAKLVFLSIKPQVMPRVLSELRGHVQDDALVFSIAAGVTIDTIRAGLRTEAIVRAMPNTPAQIGEGITMWTATEAVTDKQRQYAESLLSALGESVYATEEKELDMATALSGTGPAYVFLFMEAMIDAGVHLGFSRRIAETLVNQTVIGSALFAKQAGLHKATLRNQVTSPGGTTAEALYQ
jgi:pyrroline-5-carboxylate reductase